MDADEKLVSVVLVSAYAPIGAGKEAICHDFATELERCIEAPKSFSLHASMPLSMGQRTQGRDQVLGLFGVNHVNDAGRELHDLLCAKGMCSAATFFQNQLILRGVISAARKVIRWINFWFLVEICSMSQTLAFPNLL